MPTNLRPTCGKTNSPGERDSKVLHPQCGLPSHPPLFVPSIPCFRSTCKCLLVTSAWAWTFGPEHNLGQRNVMCWVCTGIQAEHSKAQEDLIVPVTLSPQISSEGTLSCGDKDCDRVWKGFSLSLHQSLLPMRTVSSEMSVTFIGSV